MASAAPVEYAGSAAAKAVERPPASDYAALSGYFFVPAPHEPAQMGNEQTFRRVRAAAWRLAGWQVAVTVVLAAGAAWIGGRPWVVSAICGGGIGIVAGLYQALRMFRIDASEQPDAYMRGVFSSEALKILLTVALFIAAIRVLRVEMVPAIAAYAGTFIVYWAALATNYPWLDGREKKNAGHE